jgi:putative ABC transport system substrate-binding protein
MPHHGELGHRLVMRYEERAMNRVSERRRALGALAALALGVPPFAHAAPEGRTWRVGILSESTRDSFPGTRKAMAGLGYAEGRNIRYEFRFADGDRTRLQAFAAEMVALKLDAILSQEEEPTRVLARATSTVPIVASLGDPVGLGIARIGQPGGNITGLSYAFRETTAKALELMKAMVPNLTRIAILGSSKNNFGRYLADVWEASARQLGIVSYPMEFSSRAEEVRAFASMRKQGVRAAVFTPPDEVLTDDEVKRIAALAIAEKVATVTPDAREVRHGILLCYRADVYNAGERLAAVLDKVLRGTPPGQIPFELPTNYLLFINRGTAAALGLRIPDELLVRADRVFE